MRDPDQLLTSWNHFGLLADATTTLQLPECCIASAYVTKTLVMSNWKWNTIPVGCVFSSEICATGVSRRPGSSWILPSFRWRVFLRSSLRPIWFVCAYMIRSAVCVQDITSRGLRFLICPMSVGLCEFDVMAVAMSWQFHRWTAKTDDPNWVTSKLLSDAGVGEDRVIHDPYNIVECALWIKWCPRWPPSRNDVVNRLRMSKGYCKMFPFDFCEQRNSNWGISNVSLGMSIQLYQCMLITTCVRALSSTRIWRSQTRRLNHSSTLGRGDKMLPDGERHDEQRLYARHNSTVLCGTWAISIE